MGTQRKKKRENRDLWTKDVQAGDRDDLLANWQSSVTEIKRQAQFVIISIIY